MGGSKRQVARFSRRVDLKLYGAMLVWGVQTAFRPHVVAFHMPSIWQMMSPFWGITDPSYILSSSTITLAAIGIVATAARMSFPRRLCAIVSTGFWSYALVGSLSVGVFNPALAFYGLGLCLALPTALGYPRANRARSPAV